MENYIIIKMFDTKEIFQIDLDENIREQFKDIHGDFIIIDYQIDITNVILPDFMDIDDIERLQDIENYIHANSLENDFDALMEIFNNYEQAFACLERGEYRYIEVYTDSELGCFLVDNDLWYHDVPEELYCYMDFNKIGKQYRKDNCGKFADNGYIEVF